MLGSRVSANHLPNSVGGTRLPASVVTQTVAKEKARGSERWVYWLPVAEVP